jgi:hypothetical protein
MATFAVAISVLVIHGESKLKLLPTCIAVGIIWIFAVAPNASVFSPVLFDVMYPNSSEFTARGRGAGAIVYAFSYVTIYGICSFVISCIALIVTVCYIKRKTISGDVNIIKVPFVSIALKPQFEIVSETFYAVSAEEVDIRSFEQLKYYPVQNLF